MKTEDRGPKTESGKRAGAPRIRVCDIDCGVDRNNGRRSLCSKRRAHPLSILWALFLLLLIPTAPAQSDFVILSATPIRRVVTPTFTSTYVGVCFLSTNQARYTIQVATGMNGPWLNRLTVTANNGPTNCWVVPLTPSETNGFFLRGKLGL